MPAERKHNRAGQNGASLKEIMTPPPDPMAFFAEGGAMQILAGARAREFSTRDEAEDLAGRELGLAAMETSVLTAGQLSFLRGLMALMDGIAHCPLKKCKRSRSCTHLHVYCFWYNREEVRAMFPQVDDALARIGQS